MDRRIVCAALRNAAGTLVIGPRHFDRIMHTQIRYLEDAGIVGSWANATQGFIDQQGCFLDRKQAYEVAKAAGQIIEGRDVTKNGVLYSEMLY